MEYEINSCGYDIVFDSATIDTTIGEEAIIEVEQAINYIKSGEQEIKNHVDNVSKPELDNHVETVNKTEIYRYITEEKQPEIDEYIDNYINTESKPELNNYLQNDIKPALQVFANEKTLEFDNNAQIKQALVDASAQAAANSEITAIEKANSASQSASLAKVSETNAMVSETNAKASENSCKDILERLGTVIKIKGRVDSIDDLPTSGNLNGDVYLVGAEGLESYPEYYWFDDHWEFIGTSSNKMEWGTLQGTLSNQTDLQQALDSKVAVTGNQIIDGIKTFKTLGIRQKATDFAKGDTVETDKLIARIDYLDKNDVPMIQDYNYIKNNGDATSYIKRLYLNTIDGGYRDSIVSTYNKDTGLQLNLQNNNGGVLVPTPATNDSSTKAATTANVDAKITAQAVKLTGDQTIAGTKTFNEGMFTKNIFPKGNITLGTSTNTWGHLIEFRDTAGKRISRIQPMAIDTTRNRMGMWVNNADNTVEKGIEVWSDGTTVAPTPPTTDNSTKIATTAFVNNVLSTIYPVGSVYMGTQSTCPLATLISGSKWEVVATNIVVNVNTNAPVKGTGKVLGLTDGNDNVGLRVDGGNPFVVGIANVAFNGTVNNTVYSGGTTGTANCGLGVTTDSSKSGITATVTRTNLTINIWKRTA